MPSLNTEAVASLKIKLPTPREQEAVADRLDTQLERHRQLRTALKTQLGLLSERRDALITAAVNGELDFSSQFPAVAA